jgi:hypothetical protein
MKMNQSATLLTDKQQGIHGNMKRAEFVVPLNMKSSINTEKHNS